MKKKVKEERERREREGEREVERAVLMKLTTIDKITS